MEEIKKKKKNNKKIKKKIIHQIIHPPRVCPQRRYQVNFN